MSPTFDIQTRRDSHGIIWNILQKIPRNKRIAVIVSGGWDSAVLWFMVKNICRERNQICNAYTVPKLDGAEYYANLVLKWYADKFNIEFVPTKIVGNINSENTSDYVKSGVMEILENNLADFIFSGMNKYPPNMRSLLPEDYPLPPNDRYEPKKSDYNFICWPFENCYKTHTVQLAYTLGIADEIMNITHSCTEQDRGRCNHCWWCAERAWAFRELNKVDTGEN